MFHRILKIKSMFDANTNHEFVIYKVIFTHCDPIKWFSCVILSEFEKTTVRRQTMFSFCGNMCLVLFLTLKVNGMVICKTPTSCETSVTSSESQESDFKSLDPDQLQTSYISPHSEALTNLQTNLCPK